MTAPLPASVFHENEFFACCLVEWVDLSGGIFYYPDMMCWVDCDGCIILNMHELFDVAILRYWLTHSDPTEEAFVVSKNGDVVALFIEGS